MGASAGGNAYAEARKQGYSAEKARNYATLVGASEGGLQYALGGVRALSGSGKVLAKSVGNIDKALFRIAGDVGRNMFREGTEEYAQEILGPAYRNLLLGEKNEVKLVTKDAAYAALLGALAAGFYGAVSAAKGGGLNAPEKAGTIDGATGTGSIIGTKHNIFMPTQEVVNQQKVAEYSRRLKAGEKIPPVQVIEVPGKGRYIIDGHHRYVASQQAGIPVEIKVVQSQGPIGMHDWTGTQWREYISEEQFWGD